MQSIAEFKRALKPGMVLTVENYVYPELSGEREVVHVQTGQFSMRLPKSHPRYKDTPSGSWLSFPKREHTEFDGNSLTITREPDWNDGGPFVKITLP